MISDADYRRYHRAIRQQSDASLLLFRRAQSTPLFKSTKRWLHPLFDLETYLCDYSGDHKRLLLYDAVTGIASAFLVARLRIPLLITAVCSKRALPIITRYRIQLRAQTFIERISCQTEQLLSDARTIARAFSTITYLRNGAMYDTIANYET